MWLDPEVEYAHPELFYSNPGYPFNSERDIIEA